MKRFLLTLALFLLPALAQAQCNGVFPNNTACGNVTGSTAPPRPVPLSSFPAATPGGTSGQIQYNNAGAFGGFGPITGDLTLSIPGGVSTLATVNSNTGTFGSTTQCTTFTVNAKGLITAASQAACAGGNYTPPWTSAVTYLQSKYNANVVYMSDFMGTTTCNGTTDQFANMQAFLNQVSANGVSGVGPVTGVYAPGNCFVSATPTFTINTSNLVQQYHLIGYGTTITPDPTQALDALFISRGTFTTFADEQTGITVEGLTTNFRNNGVGHWGIEFDYPHVTILRTTCFAGDDGTTHNQVNFACIYGRQAVSTNPDTGPFWARIIGNIMKGTGVTTSALPNCLRFDGQVNALIVSQNTCNEALVGMLVVNACGSTTADCAAQANGVLVDGNAWEAISTGINFITSVPSLTGIARWNFINNRVENISLSFIDLSHILHDSTFPPTIGADMLIGTSTYVSNPNSLNFNKISATTISTGLTTWP